MTPWWNEILAQSTYWVTGAARKRGPKHLRGTRHMLIADMEPDHARRALGVVAQLGPKAMESPLAKALRARARDTE